MSIDQGQFFKYKCLRNFSIFVLNQYTCNYFLNYWEIAFEPINKFIVVREALGFPLRNEKIPQIHAHRKTTFYCFCIFKAKNVHILQ